jgi:Chagasin family peptidase inhibitor I42
MLTVFSLGVLVGIVGCASGDPGVSGVGLFNRRNVFVGDTVTISLPATDENGDAWRLTGFDSSVLRPQVRSGEFDGSKQTFKFTAGVPGETDVTFQRVRAGRAVDERQTYHVIVRNRL